MFFAGGEAGNKLFDGAGLVSPRLVLGDELKVHGGIIAASSGENLAKSGVPGEGGGEHWHGWSPPPVPKCEGPGAPGTRHYLR
jgi:hypothetical protein